jgi:hypothetical protein
MHNAVAHKAGDEQMVERMKWPTPRGSAVAEWVGLSPSRRQIVAAIFLGLRDVLPEAKEAGCPRLWELSVEAAKESRSCLTPEGRRKLDEICRLGRDPEGLFYIDRMDYVAREAVAGGLLPHGSRVYGCIATLPTEHLASACKEESR